MIRLAICDDDLFVNEQIEKYIERFKEDSIVYEVFFSAEELYSYKKKQKIDFDIYILDIEMKEMSGLELAKKLRKESSCSLFVFLTSHSLYIYQVFEVVTFDFILKPLTYKRFHQVIHRAIEYLDMAKIDFVFSYRKNSYRIPCHSIIYIEKIGRKAFIYTKENKVYQCNKNLEEIWQQLDAKLFAAIHRSCLVNLSEILEIVQDKLKLKNTKILYVGRNYRQKIKLRHLQFLKEQR